MTEYILLIPDDELAWAALPEAEKEAVYAKHRRFSEALAERGHRLKGGAELAPSSEAVVITGSAAEVAVTQGPYAESAEQLSGFYWIDTDDVDDLVQCVGVLAEAERGLELRRCGA